MPGVVPNYEFDVLVSYARADNQPSGLGGPQQSPVATLADTLRMSLGHRLHLSDLDTIRLSRMDQSRYTPPKSALLLVVLSNSFLASESCLAELQDFVDSCNSIQDARRRVFVVCIGQTDRTQWPEILKFHIAYHFENDATPSDSNYLKQVEDLSCDVAHRLNELKAEFEEKSLPERPCVYLAESGPEMEQLRASVRRYLLEEGLRVLPETWHPRAPSEYEAAVRRDLEQSLVFVQLLGKHTFGQSADIPQGLDRLQHRIAEETDKAVFRWCSPNLDLDEIEDEAHREDIEWGNVIAMGLSEFRRTVVERTKHLASLPMAKSFINVNVNEVDASLAEEVKEILDTKGFSHTTTEEVDAQVGNYAGAPTQCSGVLILYGACPMLWVRDQLWRYRRVMARSESRPPICAVFDGPPPGKERLQSTLPVIFLDGRTASSKQEYEEVLSSFTDELMLESID